MAILTVTGAVALLALMDAGWMLGIAFAVHVGMTAIVTATIARSLNGRTLAAGRADGERPRARRRCDAQPRLGAVAAGL